MEEVGTILNERSRGVLKARSSTNQEIDEQISAATEVGSILLQSSLGHYASSFYVAGIRSLFLSSRLLMADSDLRDLGVEEVDLSSVRHILGMKTKQRDSTFSKPMVATAGDKEALKYHVFLSHDWGEEDCTHKIISKINSRLSEYGFETWFDENRIQTDIGGEIARGIDRAKMVLVFLTRRYLEKVSSEGDNYCKHEFNFAIERKGTSRIIPVVMEPALLDTKRWFGPVGLFLNKALYVDMSSDSLIIKNETTLRRRILQNCL